MTKKEFFRHLEITEPHLKNWKVDLRFDRDFASNSAADYWLIYSVEIVFYPEKDDYEHETKILGCELKKLKCTLANYKEIDDKRDTIGKKAQQRYKKWYIEYLNRDVREVLNLTADGHPVHGYGGTSIIECK